MPDNYNQFRDELRQWRRRTQLAAAEELASVAPTLQDVARGTTTFGDDTGATRGSTIAYVVSGDGQLDHEAIADAALAFADDRRPGSGSDEYVDVDQAEVAVLLTAFTNYAPDLEARGAGANSFLGSTMDNLGVTLHQAAERGIARVT